jgi:diguanylate cyclase (GGDEF)-like protein
MVAERTAELEREKHELERARELLYHQATRDSLTGLLNREAALQALCAALQRNRAGTGAGLAVGLLDLDHFKQINDGHGHLVGDAVLRHVAACLGAGLREGELLGRYGGEEWLLALPDTTRAAAEARAGELARRVIAYRDQDLAIPVTLSIGLAWLAPGGEASAEELLRRADAMLYTAKREGRDRTVMEPG